VPDPLDNPVWNALRGPHASHARGNEYALRYSPDIAVFAGVPDPFGTGVSAIADIARPGETIVFINAGAIVAPPEWQPLFTGQFHQMVCESVTHRECALDATETIPLTTNDVDEMLALVQLTDPGPFFRGTPVLGGYLGIREHGRLIAMAGHRMRLDGATEISAVCTHPDARGRGYAEALVHQLAADITARGDRAFLHVSVENPLARRVYERVGFTVRASITIQVFRLGGSS
jgi:predicted GNAT family acetyltransferase